MKTDLVHIAIDSSHLALCGNHCTCSEPDLKFQDKKTGLPTATCPKCIELSTLDTKELLKRFKNE